MPQGKGTYGSQVGRPPKKKSKYRSGGSVDPFSSKNPKGIIAQKEMEAIEEQNAMPTMNAMDRSQTSPMGGEVGTGVYKEGGKVRKWQKTPKDTKFKAKFPKQTFKGKEVKPVPLPKDVSKQYFKGKEIKPAKGFYAKFGKKGKKKK